jgi:hypothetical protein
MRKFLREMVDFADIVTPSAIQKIPLICEPLWNARPKVRHPVAELIDGVSAYVDSDAPACHHRSDAPVEVTPLRNNKVLDGHFA